MGEWWREFRGRGVKDALKAAIRYAANEAAIEALIAGGGSLIHQATETLDNDQISALPTTALTIVTAPGSNKMFVVLAARAISNFTNAYTGIDPAFCGTQLLVGTDPGSALIVETDFALFGQSGQRIAQLNPWVATDGDGNPYVPVGLLSGQVNGALTIKTDNNGAGVFGGGHVDNTLMVSVAYLILNVLTGQYE